MKKFLLQTLIVYVIVIGTWMIYRNFFERKVYFVNLSTVYSKFEYTKTLEKQFEQVTTTKNNILDSLKAGLEIEYRRLQGIGNKLTDEQKQEILSFKAANHEYVQKKENFDKTNEQLLAQYDKQIWNQINEYVETYGKEKNIGIIVGSNGSGSVMYSDMDFDITDDVIAYINLKHQGH
jgi:Skp family chaperone for outer membrane proteins